MQHAVGITGGQSLHRLGSCLEDFRELSYLECDGREECHFFEGKFSWLLNIDQRNKIGGAIKVHEVHYHIGRCTV